jgi:hypothetical protein
MAHHSDPTGRLLNSAVPPNPSGGRSTTCATCDCAFRTRAKAGGRRQRYCSQECSAQAWRKEHAQEQWDSTLRRQFGITGAQYVEQLRRQSGGCAICGRHPKTNRLAVDHDHKTGKVRGLLCSPCNRHLGYFERTENKMRTYLSLPPFRYPDGFNTEASINRKADT